MKDKFYYTYVLLSAKDNNFYIGYTDNLDKRLRKHNSGLVRATKTRLPLKLVYFEACLNKCGAIKREKVLKTGFGRKYIKSRII
jgi:putative endonuclease